MALNGIIFDVDGTLFDTNALHVEAFARAFETHGYRVAPDRIAPEIGKGGDNLIPDVLGQSAFEKDGENIQHEYSKQFAALVKERGVNALPGARETLEEVRRRGFKIAIATSAVGELFTSMCESAGLDLPSLVDEIATSDDAKNSKPEPDIVIAACDKLGLSVAQCALIGDTVHDAQSCKCAGVVCIGVLTGGNSEHDLRHAGARLVYENLQRVLEDLDNVLEKASPGGANLTTQLQETLMREALEAARDGVRNGEAPIGCVLARGDGTIVARGFNEMNGSQNKTAHAEIVTFANAAGKVPLDARDLILVSTLEPCVMCMGAAMESAVDTVLWALRAPEDQGTTRVAPPQSLESQMPRIVGRVLEVEARQLFVDWLEENQDASGAEYVEKLLKATEEV